MHGDGSLASDTEEPSLCLAYFLGLSFDRKL